MLCGVPHLLRWGVPHSEGCPPFKDVFKKCTSLLRCPSLLKCPSSTGVSPTSKGVPRSRMFEKMSFLLWCPSLLKCPSSTEVSPTLKSVPHSRMCLKNVLLHWGVLIYWSVRHLLKCPQHWHGVLHSRAFSTTLGNSIIPQPYRLGSGHAQQSWATPQHNTTTVMAWDKAHPAALVWVPRLWISGLQIWLSGILFGLFFLNFFNYFCFFLKSEKLGLWHDRV